MPRTREIRTNPPLWLSLAVTERPWPLPRAFLSLLRKTLSSNRAMSLTTVLAPRERLTTTLPMQVVVALQALDRYLDR